MLDRIVGWWRTLRVLAALNYKRLAYFGWTYFITEQDRRPRISLEEDVILPFDEEIKNKKWVVIKDTGEIAVVDHVKQDGKLGVRPVDPVTAAYIPNTSEHWSWDDRIRIPHEVALLPGKVRTATTDEIPYIVRK